MVVDENRLAQTLQPIREIIEEFHPMRLEHEEGDDEEEDEEEDHGDRRLEEESIRLLKAYQQKAIRKKLDQLGRDDENESQQSQQTQEMEVDEEVSDEEANDDDDDANAAGPSGEETRSVMQRKKEEKNKKLKALWEHYEKEKSRVTGCANVDKVSQQLIGWCAFVEKKRKEKKKLFIITDLRRGAGKSGRYSAGVVTSLFHFQEAYRGIVFQR